MIRHTVPVIVTAAALSALPAAAQLAADSTEAPANVDVPASRLLGAAIENGYGGHIGEIEDLLIDPDENRLVLVQLRAGGLFEVGEPGLGLPLPDGRMYYDGEGVGWREEVRQLRRLSPLEAEVDDLDEPVRDRVARASRLLGAPLEDASGARIGRLRDLVVDSSEGDIRYAVADLYEGWMDPGRRVVLNGLDIVRRDGGRLAVRVDSSALEAAAPMTDERFPRLAGAGPIQRIKRLLSSP